MKPVLLDSNVLVHAAYRGSPLFEFASPIVQRGIKERGAYCISPQNLIEFAAVVTRPRHVTPPMSRTDVQRVVQRLFESRKLLKIYPRRATVLRATRYATQNGITGPRWYDAFLAFTMADAGISEIVTDNTRDFQIFDFLRVHDLRSLSRDHLTPSQIM